MRKSLVKRGRPSGSSFSHSVGTLKHSVRKFTAFALPVLWTQQRTSACVRDRQNSNAAERYLSSGAWNLYISFSGPVLEGADSRPSSYGGPSKHHVLSSLFHSDDDYLLTATVSQAGGDSMEASQLRLPTSQTSLASGNSLQLQVSNHINLSGGL